LEQFHVYNKTNCLLLISWQIPRVHNFWKTSNHVVNFTSHWQLWICYWRQNTDYACTNRQNGSKFYSYLDHLLIRKPLEKLLRGIDRYYTSYCVLLSVMNWILWHCHSWEILCCAIWNTISVWWENE
jgi:hypothetical protein